MENKKLVTVRYGSCLRCGRCCILSEIVTAQSLRERIESDSNSYIRTLLDSEIAPIISCKHLRYESTQPLFTRCNLFGDIKRPQFCIDHPNRPGSKTKNCAGFTFKEEWLTEEEIEKLKGGIIK